MMEDERLVSALAKRALAADLGCPVSEVEAVLANPHLSLAALGVAELLERRWAPVARAVLEGVRAADGAAQHPVRTSRSIKRARRAPARRGRRYRLAVFPRRAAGRRRPAPVGCESTI